MEGRLTVSPVYDSSFSKVLVGFTAALTDRN